MKKKSLIIIFSAIMLLTVLAEAAIFALAVDRTVYITHETEKINEIQLTQTEYKTIEANPIGFSAPKYQWQILADAENSVWVSIYDKTEKQCELSYALVYNMLDAANSVYIRCKITDEDGDTVSEPVCVNIVVDDFVSSEEEAVIDMDKLFVQGYSVNNVYADPGDAEYVTITINYVDISSFNTGVDAEIYSPYVATIKSGTEFKQTVVSPTYLGFKAIYNIVDVNGDGEFTDPDDGGADTYEEAASIKFNLDAVNSNIIIKVYYIPVNVEYAIKYFFQNINDDFYTENSSLYHVDKAKTGTIISNDDILAHAGDTTGFEKMYHIPEAVAADGSTVFECYFDRLYYLIQFDFDGGYGSDPIYARYGTPFVVNDPVKHGFEFNGWELQQVDTDKSVAGWDETIPDGIPKTMVSSIPAYDCLYKATWATIETSYTIVYWRENADDNEYSYWTSQKVTTHIAGTSSSSGLVKSNDVVSGSDSVASLVTDEQYFLYNDALTNKNVKVEGNGSTVVNVYYDRREYTIYFNSNGKNLGTANYAEVGSHVHTDECEKEDYCGLEEHIHNDACNPSLTCGLIEHKKHNANCLICTKEVHASHSDSCCTKEPHTHTKACWANVGDEGTPYDPPDVNTDGYVARLYYTSGWGWDRDYFIYIKGVWYRYNGTASNGSTVSASCGKTEHTHSEGSCTCTKEIHSHSDSNGCYSDTIHRHKESCYSYDCGKIAHEHTENCKCTLPEYGNISTKTNIVYQITAKYNQNIADIWPTSAVFPNLYGWDNYVSKRITMTGDMCNSSGLTLYAQTSNRADTYVLYYMFESFNQNDGENLYVRRQRNSVYYDRDPIYSQTSIRVEGNLNPKTIMGLESVNSSADKENGILFLYYKRLRYTFKFQNVDTIVKTIDDVMFEFPIKDLRDSGGNFVSEFEPDYPSTLEPDAYYFDGWYTTPDCFDGTEYDFEESKMPESDITLYAKWTPEVHKVEFYKTLDEMNASVTDPSVEAFRVKDNVIHSHVVGSITDPEMTDSYGNKLNFGGWFYLENGEKKAFTPLDFPIKRDMKIFADWGTKQPEPFRVKYVLKNDPTTEVSDPSIGFAYNGSTRTFVARAGAPYNQLYAGYNQGYFPTVGSHSITIQHEPDKENLVNNVYQFEYVQATNVKYTVKYLDKETNLPVAPEETFTTNDAVVTERFKAVKDKIPDAFYKRLVISVEEDENGNWVGTEENVIIFYYSPNTTSAYYAVHFMLEKLNATDVQKAQYYIDGSGGYEESGSHIEGIGTVNNKVSITPLSFTGFDLISNKTTEIRWNDLVAGQEQTYTTVGTQDLKEGKYELTVTTNGTELYIFYSRKVFDYNVYYYEYGTTNTLSDSKLKQPASYDSTVEETAKTIANYTLVSAVTQSRVIKDNTETDTATINDIIFYYAPSKYVVDYKTIPTTDVALTQTREIKTGNETFVGSRPIANSYYTFQGWFKNEEHTIPVTTDDGTYDAATGHFTPNKDKLSDSVDNVFYAYFTPNSGDLTIKKTGAWDDDQVFVYEVKSKATGEVITVTVGPDEDSVTITKLLLGEYIVTQKNDWSWRYGDSAIEVSHQNPAGTTVQFSGGYFEQWLNGNSPLEENQKGD